MTKKIVKRTDTNNETLYFYTHSDAVDVGEGSSTKSLTEVIDDTLHKSAQTLTNAEKTQALTNLGLNGVDDVPTENSNNVVRSGGVKDAIDDVIDDFTNRGFMYKGIAPVSAPLGEDKTFYIAKSGDYSAYTGIGNDGSFSLNGIAVLTYATATTSGAWTKNDIVLFDDEPTAGSENLVKSGGVKIVLDSKVNKETGKGIIPLQYAEEANSDELIQATTDNEGRVLQGIDKEGKHVFNSGIEVGQLKTESGIESGDWLDVKTDREGRILEGINKDGEKHISKFDKSTQDLINGFAGGSAGSNYISIPVLDANFTSPVPVEITGTKGNEDAKYVFDLPLSEDAFNIRFKFNITENLLNQNKNAVIAKLGEQNVVTAKVTPLVELTEYVTFNDERKTEHWPTTNGGVSFNRAKANRDRTNGYRQNLGAFAFSIQYTGNGSDASIENNGSGLILTVDGIERVFDFNTYMTVYSLYTALSELEDFAVDYQALENHQTNELAIFGACKLITTYYRGNSGGRQEEKKEYVDAAPFFVPYAVANTWHTVEIVKQNGSLYSIVDGVMTNYVHNGNNLTLGGDCGVLFKDLEVYTNSVYDAEIFGTEIISSMHPYILIMNGHNAMDFPMDEISPTEYPLAMSIDRLSLLFDALATKGYIPVSISDIADFYAGTKSLPKRCYNIQFDDHEFEWCLDLRNRSVFRKYDVRPTLVVAALFDNPKKRMYNGESIPVKDAVSICNLNQFDVVSHTRNHRWCSNVIPSKYIEEFDNDRYTNDVIGIDNTIMGYPAGTMTLYTTDVLEWLGFRLAFDVAGGIHNVLSKNRYLLWRVDLSSRSNLNNILSHLL